MSRDPDHDRDYDDELLLVWLKRRKREDDDDNGGGGGSGGGQPGPTATPFLVIPTATGDSGTRPVPPAEGVMNHRVQASVTAITPGIDRHQYLIQLSCVVSNLGVAGCAVGLAEFYVGDQFSVWNPNHETLTPTQVKANADLVGYATFRAPPGATVTVTCPTLWIPTVGTPTGLTEAQKGVLVQVYDAITDPMTAPFDALNDRHVARNDEVMDPILF